MPVTEKDYYDWVYGEIYINDFNMSRLSTPNPRELVIMHEMLHVYGCRDINQPSSILHGTSVGWTASNLTADANTVLKNKY